MPKPLLTPKDLADAVGVSESSMRRWIDRGQVKLTRTAGGHRRIERAEAIRFIRTTGVPVVRSDILGLIDSATAAAQSKRDEGDQLFDALGAGDRTLARSLVVSWHLAGRSLAQLFDGPFRVALDRLGELWLRERSGILVEHRATDICIDIIHHLRDLLPAPVLGAPLAIGATPTDEWHSLPSQMAAAVVRECGMRDINYGAGAPIELLAEDAAAQNAKLVWLSATTPPRRALAAQIQQLARELGQREIQLIIGGRHGQDFANYPHLTVLPAFVALTEHLAPT
jgi:excisionase family DNA binding protein